MICKAHPKYTGAKKPKASCEDCWAYWLGMSDRCKNCGCEDKARDVLDRM